MTVICAKCPSNIGKNKNFNKMRKRIVLKVFKAQALLFQVDIGIEQSPDDQSSFGRRKGCRLCQ